MPNKTGIKKPGSGRTKGAVSIVSVTVEDLVKTFTNPKMRIAVSRKFIEPFGVPYQLLEGQNSPPTQKKASLKPTITPDNSHRPKITTRHFEA